MKPNMGENEKVRCLRTIFFPAGYCVYMTVYVMCCHKFLARARHSIRGVFLHLSCDVRLLEIFSRRKAGLGLVLTRTSTT